MKKAKPQIVGIFALGALALAILAVVVFGGGQIFQTHQTFVAFFPGSLIGLHKGAPVEMRGIEVGVVTDTWVQLEDDKPEFIIPVLLEIDLSKIRGTRDTKLGEAWLDNLVARGLRAQLAARSLLTGQQSIQLNFFPQTEARLVKTDLAYDQIPTTPSESLDVVVDQTTLLLSKINKLLSDANQTNLQQALANFARLTADAQVFAQSLREDAPEFRQLLARSDETLTSYKTLAEHADRIVTENKAGIAAAVVGLRRAEESIVKLTETAQAVVDANKQGISDFSNSGLYEISNLAIDAQAAMEQLRLVLEELERDPARFLLGKPGDVKAKR